MKVLNLVDLESSELKYTIQKFPDGQQNIVITSETALVDEVIIKSRLNSWLHLELIVASVASLREDGVKNIRLVIPYILGARSDRKFEVGGNNYIKTVLAPVINSLNLNSVSCIDPHSDVLEACINNFSKQGNYVLASWALTTHYGSPVDLEDKVTFISPDSGAVKKIYKLSEELNFKGEIITCSKDRDSNGKISKVIVPTIVSHWKDIFIIDDICDGGGTFINIAKELKNNGFKGRLYLIVTHGIFSKGFEDLNNYFDAIFCANSYRDVADNEYGVKTNVKQLNVF